MISRWQDVRRDQARRKVLNLIPQGALCAEIGVWKGDFSQQILDTGKVRELFLIDPWRFAPHFPARLYGGLVAKSQTEMDEIFLAVERRFSGKGVQVIRKPSLDAAETFPDSSFDWVYIDGDHYCKAVLDDLSAWFPKARPGGFVVLDDYDWRDAANGNIFSVREAIDVFINGKSFSFAKPLKGQFVIQKEANIPGRKLFE